jgi:hypothetical protein
MTPGSSSSCPAALASYRDLSPYRLIWLSWGCCLVRHGFGVRTCLHRCIEQRRPPNG